MEPTWQSPCGTVRLYQADCRDVLPSLPLVDACVTDPPYGETSLEWDRMVDGWLELLPTKSLWCFGSLRLFMGMADQMGDWKLSQDIIWEKHNGSGFHADRFKRVHEVAAHFYRGRWADVYRHPPMTNDATKRTVRRKRRPPHMGHIEAGHYTSEDGGPRIQRSVIYARSCHGYAIHRTQKPLEIVDPLVEYAVPPEGHCVDPFMGSGTTVVSCIKQGKSIDAMENDPAAFDAALNRIQTFLGMEIPRNGVTQRRMFAPR